MYLFWTITYMNLEHHDNFSDRSNKYNGNNGMSSYDFIYNDVYHSIGLPLILYWMNVSLKLQTTTACDDGTTEPEQANCNADENSGALPCCSGEFDILTCRLYFLTQHPSFITFSAMIYLLRCLW